MQEDLMLSFSIFYEALDRRAGLREVIGTGNENFFNTSYFTHFRVKMPAVFMSLFGQRKRSFSFPLFPRDRQRDCVTDKRSRKGW